MVRTKNRNRLIRTWVLKALEDGPATTRELADRFNETYSWGTNPRMLCNVLGKSLNVENLGYVDLQKRGIRIRSTLWGLKETLEADA